MRASGKHELHVSIKLRLLKYEVDDERFIDIIGGLARLIETSEFAASRAHGQGNDVGLESECDYLEELVGVVFLVLQTKIRRVCSAAQEFDSVLQSKFGFVENARRDRILDTATSTMRGAHSLVRIVWELANYYKHRDEWPRTIWLDNLSGHEERPKSGARKGDNTRQARKTLEVVRKLGIQEFSTGNMRQAFEALGINPYSRCGDLAQEIQRWSRQVLERTICASKGN